MSIKNADTLDTMPRENVPDVNEEGLRLRQLLERTRYAQQDLADACGVTRAAVNRWVNLDTFPDRTWKKIVEGLNRLTLPPSEVRAEHGRIAAAQEDLTKLVESWKRPQLATLKHILESDFASRDNLLSFLKGALMKFSE